MDVAIMSMSVVAASRDCHTNSKTKFLSMSPARAVAIERCLPTRLQSSYVALKTVQSVK